jgi:hypothetical protein
MTRRERYGAIYWRMWGGTMLAYGTVLLATDFSDDWPLWLSLGFGFGCGLIFDGVARVSNQVYLYTRSVNDR